MDCKLLKWQVSLQGRRCIKRIIEEVRPSPGAQALGYLGWRAGISEISGEQSEHGIMVPKGRKCDQLYAMTSLFSASTFAHLSFSVAGMDDFPLCCEVTEHVSQQKFLVLAPFGTFASYKKCPQYYPVLPVLYFLFYSEYSWELTLHGNKFMLEGEFY